MDRDRRIERLYFIVDIDEALEHMVLWVDEEEIKAKRIARGRERKSETQKTDIEWSEISE